jgi:casein kinase 1
MAEQSNNTQNQKENDIIGRIYFNKFKVTKKIGQGSFGQVYQGVNLKNNEPVALKFVNYLRFNLGNEKRKQQSARN